MLDRGRFWTPAPAEGQAQFAARGVAVRVGAGLSQALLGQKTAKDALDAVAADWQRSLRRAGIGRG